MGEAARSRWALALGGGCAALVAAGLALPPYFVDALLFLPVIVPFGAMGTLLAWRKPSHPVGWLLLGTALAGALRLFGTEYAYRALVTRPGSLPLGDWVGTAAIHVWHPAWAFIAFLALTFPDGRLPPGRWRRLAHLAAAVYAVMLVASFLETSFAEDPVNTGFLDARPDFGPVSDIAGVVLSVTLGLNLGVLLLCCAAFATRMQRARGDERKQMTWVAYAAVVTVVSLPVSLLLVGDGRLVVVTLPLIPAAAAIAVFRFRLYDIDVVVNRSLVYATLTGLLLATYLGVVTVLEATLPRPAGRGVQVTAAALVAVAFAPLRQRLQSGVDLLVYGRRRDPLGVLETLSARLDAPMRSDEPLAAVAETVAQALKLPYVAVELATAEDEPLAGGHGTPVDAVERVPLTYRGAVTGQLVVAARRGSEGLTGADRRLLEELARQVAVIAHAVALGRALEQSRERLVRAREEERRRLRRDLHDGLAPDLAAAAYKMDLASTVLPGDPARAVGLLDELRDELGLAIAEVRRVAYRLRPPALDELGLVGALREHARQAAYGDGRLEIHVAAGEITELPAAAEVAAYRIGAEAITNVARHAAARRCQVAVRSGRDLVVEVVDDGVWPEGWRPGVGTSTMRERAEELGGSCVLGPLPGGGGRVLATIPLEAP